MYMGYVLRLDVWFVVSLSMYVVYTLHLEVTVDRAAGIVFLQTESTIVFLTAF